MHIGLHRTYPSFLSDFNESEFPRQIFKKSSNIKFRENTYSGFPRYSMPKEHGRTDGRTDITKLTVVFRNSAKAPKTCLSNQSWFASDTKHVPYLLTLHVLKTIFVVGGSLFFCKQ